MSNMGGIVEGEASANEIIIRHDGSRDQVMTSPSPNTTHFVYIRSDTDPLTEGFSMEPHKLTVTIAFAAIVFLGIIGNLMVIYVILSRKRLRTVTNLLLLNLAFSDVAFLVVCGSFMVVHYALTVWPLGDIWCRIIQYLLYSTCYVTVYTLVAVSLIRYIIVVNGEKSYLVRSKRNVVILIIAIWVVFLLAKIPILVVHGVSHDPVSNRTECIISGKREGQQLFASFFVFAYALPLFVICSLYIGILCHLQKHRTQTIQSSPGNRKRHVTKVVIVVVMTFAVCWLPLHVHLLVAYYGSLPSSEVYKLLLIVWHCFSYANSLFNPIIYNFFSKDFRDAFKEIMCCCCRKPTPIENGTSV